jgi:hypothetical protein
MESGILYVVYNKWIRDPDKNVMPYKIGITKDSVSERYYGLGLKMPGKFETLFAYKLENYKEAEKAIGTIFNKNNINGEWYCLSKDDIDLIEANCKKMNGKLITDEINKEIETETESENNNVIENTIENKNTKITNNTLSKNDAINICNSNGLNVNGNITFASKNKGVNKYWANPDIRYLANNWWFLLNDSINRKLYVLNIPANSISKNEIKVRSDNSEQIDLQINYNDNNLTDSRSGINFMKWIIKTINY